VLTWVIGSGGLIGSAINQRSTQRFDPGPIPWRDDESAGAALEQYLQVFAIQTRGNPWSIVWAAGAGTTVSGEDQFTREVDVFSRFVRSLREATPDGPGTFALISSAGGVHAGSPDPPFDEGTEPAPISPYGRAKLEQERITEETLTGTLPVLICRVSNAYGPGQDITKLQGLISRLALCTYRKEPLHLFVSTSTVRDYIFTTDIADAVHAWLKATHQSLEATSRIVVIASGEGTSIARLVKIAGDVSHRRIPIAMGSHPSARNQPLDSRFIPTQIPGLDWIPSTPLPVGVKAVFDDIIDRLGQASAR